MWLAWLWYTSQLTIALASTAGWVFVRGLHLAAMIDGKWRLHKKREVKAQMVEKSLPGVSIIKPLCSSDDPFLFSNLETYFTLDYPKYEILFCIQDEFDSQLRMYVDSLVTKYPHVQVKVFVGGENVGVNPKVNNMHPGYKAAKYELIMISDCRIRMRNDTLTDMVARMTDKVGLVHQMPFSCDRSGVPASSLEKIYFGTSFARMYLVANILGINCAAGMSSLIRRDILESAGGLRAFSSYLAEDFFIAKEVLKSGHHIDISSQPALQNSGIGGVGVFQDRITRWTKLRASMCLWTTVLEPFSECMVLGMLTAWSVLFIFRWDPLAFFFIHVLVWFLMDWSLLLIVQNGSLPFNKFEFLVTWLFRELMSPYLFLVAQTNREIQWRSKTFKLRLGGTAEPTEDDDDDLDADEGHGDDSAGVDGGGSSKVCIGGPSKSPGADDNVKVDKVEAEGKANELVEPFVPATS